MRGLGHEQGRSKGPSSRATRSKLCREVAVQFPVNSPRTRRVAEVPSLARAGYQSTVLVLEGSRRGGRGRLPRPRDPLPAGTGFQAMLRAGDNRDRAAPARGIRYFIIEDPRAAPNTGPTVIFCGVGKELSTPAAIGAIAEGPPSGDNAKPAAASITSGDSTASTGTTPPPGEQGLDFGGAVGGTALEGSIRPNEVKVVRESFL